MNLACFFCKQPGKSFNPQTKAYVRTKHSKICLTGTGTVNAMGDKLKMFVIGKLKSPRRFQGVQHLHCKYRNKKSWIDSVLFKEWVQE